MLHIGIQGITNVILCTSDHKTKEKWHVDAKRNERKNYEGQLTPDAREKDQSTVCQ